MEEFLEQYFADYRVFSLVTTILIILFIVQSIAIWREKNVVTYYSVQICINKKFVVNSGVLYKTKQKANIDIERFKKLGDNLSEAEYEVIELNIKK